MNILFLLTITDSYGEREHALAFARQLKNTPYKPLFFLNPALADYFQQSDYTCYFSTKISTLKTIIEKNKPVLIICCEYYHLYLSFRDYLAGLNIPLASMDGTSMGEQINSNPLQLPGSTRQNMIPANVIKLRPCPVNTPAPDTAAIRYWNLFPDIRAIPANKKLIKQMFGIETAKLIFWAISPWAMKAAQVLNLSDFYHYLLQELSQLLAVFSQKISLLLLAPFEPQLSTLGNLTVIKTNYLDYQTYQALLLGADLVISDNIIQTSMAKAFMAGINTLALINTRSQNNLNLHIYNIFPLKVRFAEDNLYYQLTPKAEVTDPKNLKKQLVNLLSAPEQQYLNFKQELIDLATPAQIIEEIIN